MDLLPIPQLAISLSDGRINYHGGTQAADVLGIPNRWPFPDPY
jgi:hypothetical protein